MLYRVIRGQGGAGLNFYGKSHLGIFTLQNVEIEKSDHSFETWAFEIFQNFENPLLVERQPVCFNDHVIVVAVSLMLCLGVHVYGIF